MTNTHYGYINVISYENIHTHARQLLRFLYSYKLLGGMFCYVAVNSCFLAKRVVNCFRLMSNLQITEKCEQSAKRALAYT